MLPHNVRQWFYRRDHRKQGEQIMEWLIAVAAFVVLGAGFVFGDWS